MVSATKAAKANAKGDQEKPGILVGEITHYFSRIQVCVVKMTKGYIKVGETVRIKGKMTNFTQKVKSLQIESVDVKVAMRGKLVGLKVAQEVREGDKLYKL